MSPLYCSTYDPRGRGPIVAPNQLTNTAPALQPFRLMMSPKQTPFVKANPILQAIREHIQPVCSQLRSHSSNSFGIKGKKPRIIVNDSIDQGGTRFLEETLGRFGVEAFVVMLRPGKHGCCEGEKRKSCALPATISIITATLKVTRPKPAISRLLLPRLRRTK